MVRSVFLVVLRAELDLVAVLLAPLDQAALEIALRLGQFFQIQETEINVIDQQPVDELVPLIEVNRPHHRLEGVAVDMLLGNARAAVRNHVDIQTEVHGQRVERLPRDDLRPQLGHKTLVAVGVFDEQIVRSHGLDHSVAQIFQTFVVDRAAVLQNQRS